MKKLNLNRSFHYSWLSLPKKRVYNGIDFFYEIGSTGGIFSDDLQCIVQLVRNGEKCTVTIKNDGGLFEPLYGDYDIETPSLNNLTRYFTYSIPENIRKRFPLLNLALDGKTEIPGLKFHYFSEYGASFSHSRWKPIKESGLYEHQMEFILKLVDCVLKVENEYKVFQKSKLYNCLVQLYHKNKKEIDNLTLTFGIIKLLNIGLKAYGVSSDGGTEIGTEDELSLDGCDILSDERNLQLDNPEVIDYLLQPYDDEINLSINNNQIDIPIQDNDNQANNIDNVTFTGDNDKHNDNHYNQKEADKAFAEEARLLEKGDIKGAESAHNRGMKHLGRIKK